MVEYIDNLSAAFYRTLFTGFRISHRFYNDHPHNNFTSTAGKTIAYGWHAPSEAPWFWYRFFPRRDPVITPDKVSRSAKEEMHRVLTAIMNRYDRPLVIKNLFHGERIPVLRELFPKARFLIVKRDKVDTALSILAERKKLGIPEAHWWSARPRDHSRIRDLPLEKRVAAQVRSLDAQIEKDLAPHPTERVRRVETETLRKAPLQTMEELSTDFLGDLDIRKKRSSYPVRETQGEPKDPQRDRIKKALEELGGAEQK